MNVVMIGGAGWPNYGDELILKAWKDYFKKNNIAKKIYFYEGTADKARKTHKEKNKNIFFRDDIERIANSRKGLSFWEQVIRGYQFIENDGPSLYKHIDFDVFKEADVIHLHGGGYLNNLWPERGFFLGFAAAYKKHFNIKIAATGIGFGPVGSIPDRYKDVLKEIFSLFVVFELRDVDYYRFLKRELRCNSLIYGIDDCFLMPLNDIFEEKEDVRSTLFLSFINYNVQNFSEKYWQEVCRLARDYDQVVFFESSPEQDLKVIDYLSSKIGIDKVLKVEDVLHKKIKVSSRDLVICSRFHVHYIFARKGVSGGYTQDSKYYDVKHQSILDRGSNFSIANTESDLSLLNSSDRAHINILDEIYTEQKKKLASLIYG